MPRRGPDGRFLPQTKKGQSPQKQIAVISSALTQVAEGVIKKLALDIVANLVRDPGEGGTPVDTGWARANWIPQIGKPADAAVGDNESVGVAQAAQSQGEGQLAFYRLNSGSVYITNNVPYIMRLNDGYSKQAPSGFVQAAIIEAVDMLKRQR